MLNKIGRTIEPCETPDTISVKVLLMSFTLTHYFLLFRYE